MISAALSVCGAGIHCCGQKPTQMKARASRTLCRERNALPESAKPS